MTRINVVPVADLVNLHLLAEYRELPRVFALAAAASLRPDWRKKQPEAYTLGRGHVLFFYDRLKWLARRHRQLVRELQRRGYEPKFTECLMKQWRPKIDASMWRDYKPTEEAEAANWDRINLRLSEGTWWLSELPFFI